VTVKSPRAVAEQPIAVTTPLQETLDQDTRTAQLPAVIEVHNPPSLQEPVTVGPVVPSDRPLLMFSPAEIDIIKHTYMPGASDDELSVFIKVCVSRQLNPFTRQIYAIKRSTYRDGGYVEVWQHQTSIDGFRLVANRTGRYRGQTTPLFCGRDGAWVEAWLHEYPPEASKVGVLRAEFDAPIYAIALWREYVQTKRGGEVTAMWAKMPSVMLAKVAEALALRKAFPEELSGLYTTDEMGQADNGADDHREKRRRSTAQPAAVDNPYAGVDAIDPADPATFPAELCLNLPLFGSPPDPARNKKGSFGGYGRKPLREVPYDLLTNAWRWYGTKLDEHRALAPDHKDRLTPEVEHRMAVMRATIPMVIAWHDREQGKLPLGGDSADREGKASAAFPFPAPAAGVEPEASMPPEAPLTEPQLQQMLHEIIHHPFFPAPALAWFQRQIGNAKWTTTTALGLAIGMARILAAIGDELAVARDERQRKEIESLLQEGSTYKLDKLTRIRDQLRASHPTGG
jgi:phage recombination protein Bet